MPRFSPDLELMIATAHVAGEGLMRRFHELRSLAVHTKTGPADLVSQADEEAEQTIRARLCGAQPAYGFLGEESGTANGSDATHCWVVDPLDGTTNFLYGAPLWGVNIALLEDNDVVAGVTWLPALNEIYVAESGQGAWLNGQRIHVSTRHRLVDSLLGCGIPFSGKPDHPLFAREMALLTPDVAGIRRTGACSVDMAYVAAGRWDAYWERSLNAWDMAPGVILAREAGGVATSATGAPLDVRAGNVCIANAAIHRLLVERLNQALAAPAIG